MKPTINAISAEDVKVISPNLDTCGFFARSIEDLELVADVFALGEEVSSDALSLSEMRIAFYETAMWDERGPDTEAAMQQAATILRSHHVEVEEFNLPSTFLDADVLKRTQKTVFGVEAEASLLKEYRRDKMKLSPKVRSLVENGSNFTVKETVEAMG